MRLFPVTAVKFWQCSLFLFMLPLFVLIIPYLLFNIFLCSSSLCISLYLSLFPLICNNQCQILPCPFYKYGTRWQTQLSWQPHAVSAAALSIQNMTCQTHLGPQSNLPCTTSHPQSAICLVPHGVSVRMCRRWWGLTQSFLLKLISWDFKLSIIIHHKETKEKTDIKKKT